jgi:hypothetical protein
METVRIRKEGYAEHMLFHDFFERYKGIYFESSAGEDLTLASKCRRVLVDVGSATAGEFQIGHTKIFLAHTIEQKLLLRLKVPVQCDAGIVSTALTLLLLLLLLLLLGWF